MYQPFKNQPSSPEQPSPEAEPSREQKFHRNISSVELYILWRDKELPRQIPWEKTADSDAEQGKLTTFWFEEPIKIQSSREVFLELDRSRLSPNEEIREGDMRFVRTEQNYDGSSSFHPEKVKEIYVHERIPLEALSIRVDPIEKTIVKKYLANISQAMNNLKDGLGVYADSIGEIIREILEYEFGNHPDDFPKGIWTLRRLGSRNRPGPEFSELFYYGIDNDLDPELRDKALFLKTDELKKYLQSLHDFYQWVISLPEIDESYRKKSSILSCHPSKKQSAQDIEKRIAREQEIGQMGSDFIKRMESEGNVFETTYGRILTITDMHKRDIPCLSFSPEWKNFRGYLHLTTGKAFFLDVGWKNINKKEVSDFLGDRFQGEIEYGTWSYDAEEPLALSKQDIMEAIGGKTHFSAHPNRPSNKGKSDRS